MSPIAEAELIVRLLVETSGGRRISLELTNTIDGAAITMGKHVVHIRPDWSMSLACKDETPLDWIPLSSEAAVHWLRGEQDD